MAIVPIPNVPGVNRYAKYLGDFSSLSNPGDVPTRLIRGRISGRVAGKIFGGVKTHFGVWGLVATAEFFAFLRDLMRFHVAKPVFFGTMANYALSVNNGYIDRGGVSHEPAPFFSKAILQAEQFMTKRGRQGTRGSGVAKLRSGLYEGQKYMGDFAAFARGDLGRVARRSAGQEMAGFFWGSLNMTQEGFQGPPNLLEVHANTVIRFARKNLRDMGKVDTGLLRGSLAVGKTKQGFILKSITGGARAALASGANESTVTGKFDTDFQDMTF